MKRGLLSLLAVALLGAPLSAAPSALLDALRYQESRYAPHCIHLNPNGTIDKGPYQFNSAYIPHFERAYNHGRHFDPFDAEVARMIAGRYLDDLHGYLIRGYQDAGVTRGLAWFGAVASYNCGLARYLRGAPRSSIEMAARVMEMLR